MLKCRFEWLYITMVQLRNAWYCSYYYIRGYASNIRKIGARLGMMNRIPGRVSKFKSYSRLFRRKKSECIIHSDFFLKTVQCHTCTVFKKSSVQLVAEPLAVFSAQMPRSKLFMFHSQITCFLISKKHVLFNINLFSFKFTVLFNCF